MRIEDQPHNGRVVVRKGGEIATIYHYHQFAFKPYLYPVVGPTGKNLTWDTPADHVHHHSIWFAHHEVNGIDFYYEWGPEGRIVHQEFIQWQADGTSPGFISTNEWIAPDGNAVLADERAMRFTSVNEDEWYLDLVFTLIGKYGEVSFTDTKEAGFPLVRMADDLDEYDGGTITAASGETGEEATYGLRAPWVDYSGRCTDDGQGPQCHGLTMMDHPSNLNHPPGLFTRSYGPVSTREGFMSDGGYTLKDGERLSLCTRIFIHRGNAASHDLDAHFQRFASHTVDEIKAGQINV